MISIHELPLPTDAILQALTPDARLQRESVFREQQRASEVLTLLEKTNPTAFTLAILAAESAIESTAALYDTLREAGGIVREAGTLLRDRAEALFAADEAERQIEGSKQILARPESLNLSDTELLRHSQNVKHLPASVRELKAATATAEVRLREISTLGVNLTCVVSYLEGIARPDGVLQDHRFSVLHTAGFFAV